MDLIFRWEPLSYLLQTGLPELGARSWEEIGNDKEIFRYNPNWHQYENMEQNNILKFMAVRDRGLLVGYASVIVFPNLHDSDVCVAYIQDIYLEPESRKGFETFRKFIGILEDNLRLMKVRHYSIGERENDPRGGVGIVYKRLGFRSVERIWTKILD